MISLDEGRPNRIQSPGHRQQKVQGNRFQQPGSRWKPFTHPAVEQSLTPPTFFDEQKCIHAAHSGAPLCAGCSFPVSATVPPTCPLGAVRLAAHPMELDAVFHQVMKDAALYRDSGGGITFSGGEPFLHAQTLRPLLQRIQAEGLSIAFETSGYFPPDYAPLLLPFINHILLDLKILARPVFNLDVTLPPDAFTQNLEAFQAAATPLTYRLVLIREFLDVPGKQDALLARLQELPPAPLELLPLHNLAETKYRQLGVPFTPLSAPTPAAAHALQARLQAALKAPVRLLSL